MSRMIPAGLVSLGSQKITTNSTVATLNSTCSPGKCFLISVETQNLRITFDGSSPAASTGVLVTSSQSPIFIEGIKGSTIKMLGAAAGAVVNVQAWKYVGE